MPTARYASPSPYSLEHAELHTAWMLRRYPEQADIPDFDRLDHETRRQLASRQRSTRLSRLARQRNHAQHKRNKKFFQATEPYIHLTLDERRRAVDAVARTVSRWGFARLFAECIDKMHFDADRSARSLAEQAFEQIVSRFEQYLQRTPTTPRQPAGAEAFPRRTSANNNAFGLLVHDHNDTVASRHTRLMRSFHDRGTLWTDVHHIIETPLFVDGELTRMVQIADLCAYALRRYVENRERHLFDPLFARAHRQGAIAVGVRHFTRPSCRCTICNAHRV